MDWLKRLMGNKSGSTPAGSISPDVGDDDTRFFEATFTRRTAFWKEVGEVDDDLIGHLLSPGLMGGADWPTTRQAYRVIRRSGRTILATDGLSDPFSDVQGMGSGFELELFIETANAARSVSEMKGTWEFACLFQIAATVANAGGIGQDLESIGPLTIELPGAGASEAVRAQLPSAFISEDDAVGFLIGGLEPGFPSLIDGMPLTPVQVVPVVLITAAELEHVRTRTRAARQELAAALTGSGAGHVSRLDRQSCI